MRIYFVCVGLFLSGLVVGQDLDSIAKIQRDSVRAINIMPFRDHFFLWPVIKQKSLSFEIQNTLNKKEKLVYKPNNAFTLGFGAYIFELGVELTFAVPINEKSEARHGSSSSRDFQLNALGKRWGGDIFYQRYSRFYVEDPNDPVPPDQPLPQRVDIDTRKFGISSVYIFNDTKFSFKSAFNFAERQLKSSGSFLLMGNINSFKVTADSSIVGDQVLAPQGLQADFKELKHTTFSIAPGYAYNLIYKDFFLNATLFLGPAHNWIYYERDDGSNKNDTNINLFSAIRVGIGYNSEKLFAGLNYITQARSVEFEGVRFTNSSSTLRLLVGYRFKEFGILKKSVRDLPPLLGF